MIDFHAHLGKVVTAPALTVEKLLRFMDQHASRSPVILPLVAPEEGRHITPPNRRWRIVVIRIDSPT